MNRSRVTGNLSSHGILFSDITNDRVGIGSTIPTQKLDVTGIVKATSFVGSGANLTGIDATTIKHTDGNIKAQAIATGVNVTGNLAINADSDNPAGNAATNYLSVGASQDLKLYHNGSQNYITAADGTLLIQADNIMLVSDDTAGRSLYQDNANSRLELGFDGTAAAYFSSSSIQFIKPLDVTGNITGTGDLTLTDTTADANAGPEFKLFRNSASPADADYLGQIKFAGESDTGVERNYAKITGKILDASNGTEDGIIEFAHIKAGSQVITGRWRSDSLQLLNSTNLSVAGTSDFTGDATFNGGAGAISLAADSDIRFTNSSSWTGDAYGKIQQLNNRLYIGGGSDTSYSLTFRYNNQDRVYFKNNGTIWPQSDSTSDLGTSANRWANGYFDTLYGDGSNLTSVNATTLDSIDSGSFLRSDATDTASGALTFTGDCTFQGGASAIVITSSDIRSNGTSNWTGDPGSTNGKIQMHSNRWYIVANGNSDRLLQLRQDGSDKSWFANDGQLYHGSNGTGDKYWRQGNDGSGSGLDADTVDGIQGANFVRSDTSDTMSGTLSVDRIDVTGSHGMDNEAWYRNDDSGDGLYNTATGQHFYSDDDDYWNIAGGTGANGLRFRDDHAGTIRGYVYANNSNQVGLLNQSGAWTIRTETAGITKLGSAGNGYQIKDGNVSNNLYIYTGATGSASSGISVFNADGAWRFQLYGSSSQYGFLDANWNSWDIQKTPSGAFNVDEGSGLQRVWNAGNDGSGSGLDADTVDGIQGASFVRADASDTVTGAPWQLSNSGTSNWGFRLVNNTGTNNYVYFCHGTHGMHLRNDSAGTSQYLLEVYRSGSAYFKIRGGDCYTTLAGGMQITGTLSSARVHIGANSDIRLSNGTWSGEYSCKIQMHSNYLYIQGGSNGHIFRRHTGANAWFITGDGHFHPGTNDDYDIGTSSNRVRNLYTTDLQLSNESKKDRGGNNVDGTWGDWTLQEGEDKIFMINNRTGKKYSLIMKEEN